MKTEGIVYIVAEKNFWWDYACIETVYTFFIIINIYNDGILFITFTVQGHCGLSSCVGHLYVDSQKKFISHFDVFWHLFSRFHEKTSKRIMVLIFLILIPMRL